MLNLTGTGDLGAQILEGVPEPFRPQVEPIIPQIVQAIHEAFAIAIAWTFWISVAAAVLAAVFVLFLRHSGNSTEPRCARGSTKPLRCIRSSLGADSTRVHASQVLED